MKTSDFYYDLPEELIAQRPAEKRVESRLLVVDRKNRSLEDKHFSDIIDYLHPGDCLVINESKVFKARLLGNKIKEDGSIGANIELFLLRALGNDTWEALVKPGKRMQPGKRAVFGNGALSCEVLETLEDGSKKVRLDYEGDFDDLLNHLGEMPLPPYIKEKLSKENEDRYQTVYAREKGSVAAPTAGLHFDQALLRRIEEKGIKIARLTLHVGIGTFRPVKEERVEEHKMHTEYYRIDQTNADLIEETKRAGGRVISVGTTTTRVLESLAARHGRVIADEGKTDIFILPPYEYKVVDSLITNFHLPESTLIMLVSAFYDRERVLEAYRHAVEQEYRFFSFGDAMFLI